MKFDAYDNSKFDAYAAEAKARWGKTDAYKEFEKKTEGKSKGELQSARDALMAIFTEIGAISHLPPESAEAQGLIAKLQAFITEHYYTCTPQILKGLGMMYIAGDSMTENIDKAGGPGTAEFAHRAIEIFTK